MAKPSGITPTIVVGMPAMRTVVPTTSRAPPRRLLAYVLAAAVAVVSGTGMTASLAPTLKYVRMGPGDTLRVDG